MIITADSGSTSIDWRVLRPGETARKLESPGVNPVLQDVGAMQEVFATALRDVAEEVLSDCGNAIPTVRVYFYGAVWCRRQPEIRSGKPCMPSCLGAW